MLRVVLICRDALVECGSNVRDSITDNARLPYSKSQTFKLTVPEGDGLEVVR